MASEGGCLNIKDVDQIALQAARDKIDQLIQERKNTSNNKTEITDDMMNRILSLINTRDEITQMSGLNNHLLNFKGLMIDQ